MTEEKVMVSDVREDEGLSIKDIFRIIKKHFWVIVAIIVVCTGAGFVYSRVKAPEYKATSTMIVEYEGSDSSNVSTTYSFSNYISSTLVVFIKEDVVLRTAAKDIVDSNLFPGKTEEEVLSTLKSNVSSSNKNLIITVDYTDTNKERTIAVVNAVTKAAQNCADAEENGTPKYHLLNNNLKVLSPAVKATKQSSTLKILVIFFAGGAVLAFIYVFLREIFDNSYRSNEDIERELRIPVLASIPEYDIEEANADKKGGK